MSACIVRLSSVLTGRKPVVNGHVTMKPGGSQWCSQDCEKCGIMESGNSFEHHTSKHLFLASCAKIPCVFMFLSISSCTFKTEQFLCRFMNLHQSFWFLRWKTPVFSPRSWQLRKGCFGCALLEPQEGQCGENHWLALWKEGNVLENHTGQGDL